MEALRKIWVLFVGFFWHERKVQIGKVQPKPKRRRAKPESEKISFQYQTIRELLDDMDETFKNLRRMRPTRHSVQRVVKKYGPFMMGKLREGDLLQRDELEGFEAYGLPTFLIGYWPGERHIKGRDLEVFQCAIKTHSLPYAGKRPDCTYYEVATVIMPDKQTAKDIGMKKPAEINYYIEVNKKTGAVRAAKTPWTKQIQIPARNGRPVCIHRQVWDLPDYIKDEGHHSEGVKAKFLEERFEVLYSSIMRREYGVNILVKKAGYRATFIVPQNRWKYFFRERVDVKTAAGKNRPIFHAVIAHSRHLKSGKVTDVKTHYRGSRHFVWNGYEIRIVMQGKHGKPQASFGSSTVSEEDTPKKTVSIFGPTGDLVNKEFEGDTA
jgi:hypothetical protein